jgi:hypothetical protein
VQVSCLLLSKEQYYASNLQHKLRYNTYFCEDSLAVVRNETCEIRVASTNMQQAVL